MAKITVMDVNEGLLATKLEELDGLLPDSGDLRGLLESFSEPRAMRNWRVSTPSRSHSATAATKRV
jgi:hypothetical protein